MTPSPNLEDQPNNREFRSDVKGLRAVAINMLVPYHAGVPKLAGGFVGVDVFFVPSGFLITGLLLKQVARTGTVSPRDFYARRARRILPAAEGGAVGPEDADRSDWCSSWSRRRLEAARRRDSRAAFPISASHIPTGVGSSRPRHAKTVAEYWPRYTGSEA